MDLFIVYGDAEMYVAQSKYNKPGTIPLAFGTEIRMDVPPTAGSAPIISRHVPRYYRSQQRVQYGLPLCFSEARPGFSLTLEEVEAILDDFVRTEGNPEVVQFSGSEPTIHPEIIDFVRLRSIERRVRVGDFRFGGDSRHFGSCIAVHQSHWNCHQDGPHL